MDRETIEPLCPNTITVINMNKKIFDSETSPIFNFLTSSPSQPEYDEASQDGERVNVKPRTENGLGKRRNQENRKTKRLNLLIQPSLHEKLAKIACMKQTSVNAIIIEASKEYCAKEARALEKYERTFGQEAEEV